MIIEWSPAALRDRDEIYNYISDENPQAADRLDLRFEQVVDRLALFPFSARPGVIEETRELIPHPRYRIVYQVAGDKITILGVLHTSMLWPPEPGE